MRRIVVALCLLTAVSLHAASKKLATTVAAATAKTRRARAEIVGEEIPLFTAGGQPKFVQRPSATFIAVHFISVTLGPGDSLVVSSPEPGGRSWTYTSSDVPATAKFWAVNIPGDRANIDLTNASGNASYTVDKYSAGLQPARIIQRNLPPAGQLQICGTDDTQEARCYSGPEYDNARPVARLLINGQFACTGWLIGAGGHLLTNEHCIQNKSDAANLTVEIMAEGATCATNCDAWFACPGTVVATSAKFIKASPLHDYALVQLPATVPAKYGYLRVRKTGAVNGEVIYIPQHPRGAGKRVAVLSTDPADAGGATGGHAHVNTTSGSPCNGGNLKEVGYAADTDHGSSGSPVLGASDGLVVALHHCAGCPNRAISIDRVIGDLPPGTLPATAFGNK
jgi:hypothetical protein